MAIWEKLFSKITFKNYPDTSTPINADNLNKMTDAIDGIDDRVVELNSNLEKWNLPNKNILITSDSTNDSVITVSTDDPNSDWNKPCRVHQLTTGSAIRNMPSVFPQGTGFVGIRYVDYFNQQNICIRLEEISPVMGRVWTRKWDGSAWGKWDNSLGKPIRVASNITIAAGESATVSIEPSTVNYHFEILYYAYNGFRMSVKTPVGNTNIPFLEANNTFSNFSTSLSDGVLTLKNNSSSTKVIISAIYIVDVVI